MIEATNASLPMVSVNRYFACAGPMPSGGAYISGYAGFGSRLRRASSIAPSAAVKAATASSRISPIDAAAEDRVEPLRPRQPVALGGSQVERRTAP